MSSDSCNSCTTSSIVVDDGHAADSDDGMLKRYEIDMVDEINDPHFEDDGKTNMDDHDDHHNTTTTTINVNNTRTDDTTREYVVPKSNHNCISDQQQQQVLFEQVQDDTTDTPVHSDMEIPPVITTLSSSEVVVVVANEHFISSALDGGGDDNDNNNNRSNTTITTNHRTTIQIIISWIVCSLRYLGGIGLVAFIGFCPFPYSMMLFLCIILWLIFKKPPSCKVTNLICRKCILIEPILHHHHHHTDGTFAITTTTTSSSLSLSQQQQQHVLDYTSIAATSPLSIITERYHIEFSKPIQVQKHNDTFIECQQTCPNNDNNHSPNPELGWNVPKWFWCRRINAAFTASSDRRDIELGTTNNNGYTNNNSSMPTMSTSNVSWNVDRPNDTVVRNEHDTIHIESNMIDPIEENVNIGDDHDIVQSSTDSTRHMTLNTTRYDDHSDNDDTTTTTTTIYDRHIGCDICLCHYKVNDIVAWSKNDQCIHGYHVNCIMKWLKSHNSCPNCRCHYIVPDHRP